MPLGMVPQYGAHTGEETVAAPGASNSMSSCADDRTEIVSAASAHNEKTSVIILNLICFFPLDLNFG